MANVHRDRCADPILELSTGSVRHPTASVPRINTVSDVTCIMIVLMTILVSMMTHAFRESLSRLETRRSEHVCARRSTIGVDSFVYGRECNVCRSNHQRTTIALFVILTLLLFVVGIANNVFSFLTFRQRPCLRHGMGYYLLSLSIINQINLGLLFARLALIIVNISTTTSASTLSDILCKLLNYLLLSSSRLVFWLSSLIAIERVYTTLFLNRQWLKQPHIARRLIALFILAVLVMNLYELLFYRSVVMCNTNNQQICMFELPLTHHSRWVTVHVLVNALNALLPFFINLFSVITISNVVVKNKMNTLRAKKSQSRLLHRSPALNPLFPRG
jgi:hypothetical protein